MSNENLESKVIGSHKFKCPNDQYNAIGEVITLVYESGKIECAYTRIDSSRYGCYECGYNTEPKHAQNKKIVRR